MCLAQGPQRSDAGEARTRRPMHFTTEPLRSQNVRDVKPLFTFCIPETPNWVLWKTQMKCHTICHFIQVCTVCYGKIHTQRKKYFGQIITYTAKLNVILHQFGGSLMATDIGVTLQRL